MADTTAAERVKRHRQRQRDAGFVELRLWVTDQQAAAIRAFLAGEPLPIPPSAPAEALPTAPPIPAAVVFPNRPPVDLQATLRDASFTQQSRRRWIGSVVDYAHADLLMELVSPYGGRVELDDPDD